MTVHEDLSGHYIRCRSCGAVVVVPTRRASEETLWRPVAELASRPRPRVWPYVAAICALLFGFCLLSGMLTPSTTSPTPTPVPERVVKVVPVPAGALEVGTLGTRDRGQPLLFESIAIAHEFVEAIPGGLDSAQGYIELRDALIREGGAWYGDNGVRVAVIDNDGIWDRLEILEGRCAGKRGWIAGAAVTDRHKP